MKALIIYAGFVIASTAAAVLVGSYIERLASPQIGLFVILRLFFTRFLVSWIATYSRHGWDAAMSSAGTKPTHCSA